MKEVTCVGTLRATPDTGGTRFFANKTNEKFRSNHSSQVHYGCCKKIKKENIIPVIYIQKRADLLCIAFFDSY